MMMIISGATGEILQKSGYTVHEGSKILEKLNIAEREKGIILLTDV
jgi:hypothetical protein